MLGRVRRSTIRGRTRTARSSYSTAHPLKGKTALVTGSTSGIGLGFAHALAKNGANVILNGFGTPDEIRNVIADIAGSHKVKVHYNSADMSVPEQISKMIKEAEEKFGGVDILINNAGIQHVSPVEAFPDAKWDQIIAVNLTAVFHAIKAVIPTMKKKGWGRIINISSVHGLVASVNKSAYVTSKHGVVGLSKVTALELAGTGITVNCINPGWTLTALVQKQIDAKAVAQNTSNEEATRQLLEEKQPSKQFVTIDQLAGLGMFLCSPAADQITGISIPVDGGWTAQ